jgi:hypothetical protein
MKMDSYVDLFHVIAEPIVVGAGSGVRKCFHAQVPDWSDQFSRGLFEVRSDEPARYQPAVLGQDAGRRLAYANIGHGRWVTGQSIIEYITRQSETKNNRNAPESI